MRWAACLIVIAGCSSKKQGAPRAAGRDAGGVAVVAGDAAAPGDAAAAAHAPTLVPRDTVEAFVATWLASQNQGDFDGYSALYADEFRGVRRSGKQTVRMDRKKWLADRKKMFGKPMKVGAADVQIMVSPRGAVVRFTQDWASGTYHDTGPKQLELEVRPTGGLVLVREEMLASHVAPPAGAAGGRPILPVYHGMIVLSGDVAPGWGDGKVTLDGGTVREQDPDLDCEDTPDYEQDQHRYWACHNSDPANASDRFVATGGVVRGAVGAHAAWIDRAVSLGGGAGGACTGKISALRLYGEWEATYEAVTDGGKGTKSIAAAVLARAPVLVGVVDGGCDAAWAVAADAPAPVAWTTKPAPADLAGQALRGLEAVDGYADLMDDPYGGAPKVAATVIEHGARRFVLATRHGYRSCQETGGLAALFELSDTGTPELVFETDAAVDLRAALDADGDGWPELVLADGIVVHAGDDWDRWRPIDFPDEVGDCYCECE